jgi:hypothetical protein
MALQSFLLDLGHFFQILNPIHSPQDSSDGDGPVARPLPTQTQNKLRQISTHLVVSNPRSQSSSERWHALDRVATAIGSLRQISEVLVEYTYIDHDAEFALRSYQLLNYSRISQRLMEPEG